MNWLGAFNMAQMGSTFVVSLRAYSTVFCPEFDQQKVNEINYGGKILLPQSVLDQLMRRNIQYPMLFKLTNVDKQRSTHCGVLEFSAPEGKCYLSAWMMQQLRLDENGVVQIENVSLPLATYAKLQPQNLEFLQITNPRAVLEMELRKYACLTVGDLFAVRYNDQTLEFLVKELKPKNGVCIIECDVNLEFDAPKGHVEDVDHTTLKPSAPPVAAVVAPPAPAASSFVPFQGGGTRLDGKQRTNSVSDSMDTPSGLAPIVPNTQYKPGKLSFVRYDYKSRVLVEKELAEAGKAVSHTATFSGSGSTIRTKNKR